MRVLPLFVFLLLTFSNKLLAQKGDIVNGYIIDEKGEKIEGFVQTQKSIENGFRVKFSEKKTTKRFPIFKTKDLQEYGFEEIRKTNANEEYIHWRRFITYEFERPVRIFNSNISFIEQVLSLIHI